MPEFKRAMDGLEASPDRRTYLPHIRFTSTCRVSTTFFSLHFSLITHLTMIKITDQFLFHQELSKLLFYQYRPSSH